jgi:hypothetical protein
VALPSTSQSRCAQYLPSQRQSSLSWRGQGATLPNSLSAERRRRTPTHLVQRFRMVAGLRPARCLDVLQAVAQDGVARCIERGIGRQHQCAGMVGLCPSGGTGYSRAGPC